MRKSVSQVVLCAVLVLLCMAAPCHGAATARLTVLHVNDLHGHILPYVEKSIDPGSPMSGGGRLAKMIQDERDRNPEGCVLLAAGDMFQGTPISNVFHGKPVIELMNYLKFDAMSIGNHEFDWGMRALENLQGAADFPFLCANVRDRRGECVQGARPYVVLKRGGLKIAVIGLSTPETKYTTKPANVAELDFLEPEKVLPGLIAEARKGGAKLVFVLSHLGMPEDMALAGRVPGIDVIVGGHTHTAANDPVRVGKTIIVQAGYYGLYLGVLDLKIDVRTGRIVDYTAERELKPVKAGPSDPTDKEAERIVGNYHEKIRAEFAKVVGETQGDLVRHAAEESVLGDLVTDAMLEVSGAEVAFENGGGLRADIPKGPITLEHVYTLLPFDNSIVAMDLSGEEILEVLEQNADLEHKILQVGGLRVEYNLGLPQGSRVVKAMIGGEPVAPKRIYRVAVNDFLAAGGDQFTTFSKGRNPAYGDSMKEAFLKYLKRHSPLNRTVENRIVFVK